jgi:hypothetical protein
MFIFYFSVICAFLELTSYIYIFPIISLFVKEAITFHFNILVDRNKHYIFAKHKQEIRK